MNHKRTSASRVVVLGETMVSFVPQEQISLRYGPSVRMRIAGAESNTAMGLARLGHSAAFLSRLGADHLGEFILRMIRAEGVDTSDIILDSEHPTGVMFKEPLPGRETSVYYYRNGSAASCMKPEDLPEETIANADILHFTGITPILSESCRRTVFRAMEIAKKHNCAISFDPNIRTKLWKGQDFRSLMTDIISCSHYIFSGLEEIRLLYEIQDPQILADRLLSSGPARCLVIKDGSNGATLYDQTGAYRIPPFSCRCIDAVGAGDAFNAGFLAGVLEGKSFLDSASIGAVCGARATETSGDTEGLISREELDCILNHQNIAGR